MAEFWRAATRHHIGAGPPPYPRSGGGVQTHGFARTATSVCAWACLPSQGPTCRLSSEPKGGGRRAKGGGGGGDGVPASRGRGAAAERCAAAGDGLSPGLTPGCGEAGGLSHGLAGETSACWCRGSGCRVPISGVPRRPARPSSRPAARAARSRSGPGMRGASGVASVGKGPPAGRRGVVRSPGGGASTSSFLATGCLGSPSPLLTAAAFRSESTSLLSASMVSSMSCARCSASCERRASRAAWPWASASKPSAARRSAAHSAASCSRACSACSWASSSSLAAARSCSIPARSCCSRSSRECASSRSRSTSWHRASAASARALLSRSTSCRCRGAAGCMGIAAPVRGQQQVLGRGLELLEGQASQPASYPGALLQEGHLELGDVVRQSLVTPVVERITRWEGAARQHEPRRSRLGLPTLVARHPAPRALCLRLQMLSQQAFSGVKHVHRCGVTCQNRFARILQEIAAQFGMVREGGLGALAHVPTLHDQPAAHALDAQE